MHKLSGRLYNSNCHGHLPLFNALFFRFNILRDCSGVFGFLQALNYKIIHPQSFLPSIFWVVSGLMYLSSSLNLCAELTWNQKIVELNADAQTDRLTARFKFKNEGTEAVNIDRIKSSCGCTVAAIQERHIEPSHAGEITATFTVGERMGLQKKTIAVTSSDHPYPTILTLIVHIPKPLRIQPASVVWKQNEKNTAKSIYVEILQEVPLQNLIVQSSNPEVTTEVHIVQEGRRYQIDLTPSKTDKTLFATLTIRGTFGKVEKTFHAYASVQPAAPSDGH